jgi:pSer/pThr/pTyr-binding forkhead associated (FHA) protein
MSHRFLLQSQSLSSPGIVFRLGNGVFILGRSSKCDLVVKDPTVSRRHVEFAVTNDKVTARDIGSRNGLFVNNCRVELTKIKCGDQILIGEISFLLAAYQPEELGSETETENAHKKRTIRNSHVDLPLSDAQRRVLALILEGLAEKQIASRLHSSPRTVHNHIQAIYRSFNVHSRSELLARYIKSPTLSAKEDSELRRTRS